MFFTQINQLMSRGTDINLVIRKTEDQLTVSVLPKSNNLKDEAQNYIIPLTLTGTPEELDRVFLSTVCRPLQKVSGLLSNMNQFEQQAEKAAENSKAQKELKDVEAKEAKEKKEKFDKLIKAADEQVAERKYAEAIAGYQKARTIAQPQALKSVDEKITAAKSKLGQGSLFEVEIPVQPQAQPQHEPQQYTPQVQPQQPMQQQPMQPLPELMNGFNNSRQPAPSVHPVQRQHPGILPMQNYQQPMYGNNGYGTPVYPQGQVPDQNGMNPPPDGYRKPKVIPDLEPELAITSNYDAHREGEYDQYPDFPGYPGSNGMHNPQNR